MNARVLLTNLLLLTPWTTGAVEPDKSVDDIRACMAANYPADSVRQSITLVSTDRAGGERKLDAQLYARKDDKRTSMMIKVNAPTELAGGRYLYREKQGKDELYMYIPAVDRIRRVKGSQKSTPLWGTDFSYEDIQQLRGNGVDMTSKPLPDTTINGRAAWVIENTPEQADQSAYTHIVSVVDQQTCLPLQIEFFEDGPPASSSPRKRLQADPTGFVDTDKGWALTKATMADLRDETQTTVDIGDVVYDEKIPSQVFSTQNFHRGG